VYLKVEVSLDIEESDIVLSECFAVQLRLVMNDVPVDQFVDGPSPLHPIDNISETFSLIPPEKFNFNTIEGFSGLKIKANLNFFMKRAELVERIKEFNLSEY
jgi:hypothetical protein